MRSCMYTQRELVSSWGAFWPMLDSCFFLEACPQVKQQLASVSSDHFLVQVSKSNKWPVYFWKITLWKFIKQLSGLVTLLQVDYAQPLSSYPITLFQCSDSFDLTFSFLKKQQVKLSPSEQTPSVWSSEWSRWWSHTEKTTFCVRVKLILTLHMKWKAIKVYMWYF